MSASALPWDRQEAESSEWFARFEAYRLLGPARTIEAVWKVETKGSERKRPHRPNRHWYEMAARFIWKARAELWDALERDKRLVEWEADRKADRLERVKLLKAHRTKLVQAMLALQPADASWADVTKGLQVVMDQLRAEYDDEPARRVNLAGKDGGDLVVKIIGPGASMADL